MEKLKGPDSHSETGGIMNCVAGRTIIVIRSFEQSESPFRRSSNSNIPAQ